MRKLVCHLCLLFIPTIGFSGASAASEIVIPGLESSQIVEAWVDDELLLLKAVNGRLYSVLLSSVDLSDFSFPPDDMDRLDQPAGASPSLEDILELIRAGVSEANIRTFIETSADYDWRMHLTAGDLVALKQAGAGEELIQFLLSFDGSRPRTTYIAWKTPFSPRKDLPPTVPSNKTTSSTDIEVREGIPYFPYIYPGYGYAGPTYPVFPPRPVHPIEKPVRSNRTTPRPFYRPRQPIPPVATPFSRTLSASRGNQLWIRWSLPRAANGNGYARSQSTGSSSRTLRSSYAYGNPLTGSSSSGIRATTGSSNRGSTRASGAGSWGARSAFGRSSIRGGGGSSSSRGSSGARGVFSRSRSNR